MEVVSSNITTQPTRSSECEVCGKIGAKYTCPRCELRTCCLECVKVHKKELECSGLRDKVMFKTIKKLNSIDLLNDYRLLEETARLVNKSVKLPPVSCHNSRNGKLPSELYRLRCTALSRGVQLVFLPPNFSKHKENTSHLVHETQDLFWRIDWVFVQAENLILTDEHVLDSTVLSTCIHRYIDSEGDSFPSLSFYQAAGHTGIKFLLKAEKTVPIRYHVLDATATLRENLNGKSLVEYPVVYVVLNNHIDMFNIFTEEEEEKYLWKRQRRRQHRGNNRNKQSNFLFSNNTAGQEEVHEKMQCPEDASDFQETNGCVTPLEGNGFSSQRGRGYHRNNYRGGNRFYFKRNGRGKRHNPE